MLFAVPASETVDFISSRSAVLTLFAFLVSTHVTFPAFCLPKMLHLRSPSSAALTTSVLSCCTLESKLLLCYERQNNFTNKYILPIFFPPGFLYMHIGKLSFRWWDFLPSHIHMPIVFFPIPQISYVSFFLQMLFNVFVSFLLLMLIVVMSSYL